MSEKQQTAVEWFHEQLLKGEFINDPDELLRQANEMEKEQMCEFANNYGFDVCGYDYEKAQEYYSKTYSK